MQYAGYYAGYYAGRYPGHYAGHYAPHSMQGTNMQYVGLYIGQGPAI